MTNEKSYDHILLDLDGTVYLSYKPIDSVVNQLNRLVSKGIDVIVITNNTSTNKETYHERLLRIGLCINAEKIITPTEVAGSYLRKNFGKRPRGFIVGTTDLINELENKYNIQNVDDHAKFILVGFDKSLTYSKLEKACEYIYSGIPYYLTNIDLSCPTSVCPIPDTGSIAKLLEMVTGVKPITSFGKPGELLAEYLMSIIKNPENTMLAGDRLYTDIVLGQKMGIDTLLVFSGETKPQNLSSSIIQPTYTANTLAEFLENRFVIN